MLLSVWKRGWSDEDELQCARVAAGLIVDGKTKLSEYSWSSARGIYSQSRRMRVIDIYHRSESLAAQYPRAPKFALLERQIELIREQDEVVKSSYDAETRRGA